MDKRPFTVTASGLAVPCPDFTSTLVFSGILEQMHSTGSAKMLSGFSRVLFEGSEFVQRVLDKHPIIYMYPQETQNIDQLKGFFTFREIEVPPPGKNIIKGGGLGYLDRHDLDALIRKSLEYVYCKYPPSTHRIILGVHRTNHKLRQLFAKFNCHPLTDFADVQSLFRDMGQSHLKKIAETNGEVFYTSEKGDEKVLYEYSGPHVLRI